MVSSRLVSCRLIAASLALVGAGCSGGGAGLGSSGAGTSGLASAGTTGGLPTQSSSAGSASGSSAGSGSTSGRGTTSAASSGVGTSSGSTSAATTGSSGGGACAVPDNNPCVLGTGLEGLCCGGLCADVSHDALNCGGCGLPCGGTAACSNGACVSPNCDGAAVGSACAGNAGGTDASETCVAGVCVLASCTAGAGPQECAAPLDAGVGVCCGASCASASDPENCGGCGLRCPSGASCSQYRCSSDCAVAGCPSGLTCVPGDNGDACAPPTCAGSVDHSACALDAGRGGSCCGQACVSVETSDANCGICGNACGSGSFCEFGTCQVNVDCANAPAGSVCGLDNDVGYCCGGACQVGGFKSDSLNCGTCGAACPIGSSCQGGNCVVPDAGFAYCQVPGESCPSGYECVQQCLTVSCAAGQALDPCALPSGSAGACCGAGACSDLSTDDQNCGQCGSACGTGQFCDEGQCAPTPACTLAEDGQACPVGPGVIGLCCQGGCVDPRSDSQNCAGCGQRCAFGGSCVAGGCQLADGGSAACSVGSGCPSGTLCYGGICETTVCPPAEVGLRCAFGPYVNGTCCGGSCVSLTQDPDHCGSCGQVCDSGICEGNPISQPGPAACLPPSTGASGTCGGAGGVGGCPPQQTCVQNTCVSSSCGLGLVGELCTPDGMSFGLCCASFFSTACVNPATDSQNCGGCNVKCPAGQTCVGGACSGDQPACPVGSQGGYCNPAGGPSFLCCAGGGCTDLRSDTTNCGGCGQVCQSGQACVGGQCLVLACTAGTQGYACGTDGGAAGTCCSASCLDLMRDPLNCGACGQRCAGSESCNGGACGLDACSASSQGDPCHFDAGSFLAGGACCASTCTDIQSDPLNCGGCNLPCVDAGCLGGLCE